MTDTSPQFCAGREPRIADMLADPLVRVMMARDGVSREEVLRVMREVNDARGSDPRELE